MLAISLFAGLIVAAGTALATLGTAQPAAKPKPPTFVITGHGWGHRVGMGQYGALGYARRGVGYARILAQYYPGTVLTRTSVRQVRVLLADGARRPDHVHARTRPARARACVPRVDPADRQRGRCPSRQRRSARGLRQRRRLAGSLR